MDEGRHRVGAMVIVPDVLREFGANPEAVLRAAGLPANALEDPEGGLTFPEVGRLLQACVAATGCEHFGHLFASRCDTTSLALIGALMRNAPTVGDAIMDLCTNQVRYIRGAVTYLAVQGDVAIWGYGVSYPGIPGLEQLCEGAIAVGFNMFRELARRGVDEVLSARAPVADPWPYRMHFAVTPRWDAEQHALVFPTAILAWPVIAADPQARRALEGKVAQYWAARQPTVAETAMRQLRARVVLGDATRESTARHLRLSERSLNRRLQEEGTSYRELLDRARFQVAQQLLLGTRMSVTSVALALGYAETSAFNHAFRRWSGQRPGEWRSRPPDAVAD
jgi:AraC-like DNA-binding protein